MTRRAWIVVILLLVVALTAWFVWKPGSGNVQRTPSGRVPTEAPDLLPAATRPLQQVTTVLITIRDRKFIPAVVSARVGDTIRWTNNDTAKHSIAGGEFKSQDIAPGATYEAVATQAGTVDYSCGVHPEMHGQLVVQPAN